MGIGAATLSQSYIHHFFSCAQGTAVTTFMEFWILKLFRSNIDPLRRTLQDLYHAFGRYLGEPRCHSEKCSLELSDLGSERVRYSRWNVWDLGSTFYIHLFRVSGGFPTLLCGEIVLNWWKSWSSVSSCFVPTNNSSEPHKRFQPPLSIRYSRGIIIFHLDLRSLAGSLNGTISTPSQRRFTFS